MYCSPPDRRHAGRRRSRLVSTSSSQVAARHTSRGSRGNRCPRRRGQLGGPPARCSCRRATRFRSTCPGHARSAAPTRCRPRGRRPRRACWRAGGTPRSCRCRWRRRRAGAASAGRRGGGRTRDRSRRSSPRRCACRHGARDPVVDALGDGAAHHADGARRQRRGRGHELTDRMRVSRTRSSAALAFLIAHNGVGGIWRNPSMRISRLTSARTKFLPLSSRSQGMP